MAIKGVGNNVKTPEEFKRWLLKKYDSDHDGRISRDELREVIRDSGGWFSTWKSKRAVTSADANGDGYIDEDEMDKLLEFAQKQLGIKIVTV